ncbi:MAG TPA: methyltransferase domain-containing protein, partial [Gaiellaceae bacterium]|nr:methyltransferase domain-containing protein [Gaiellaceae bacterium]
MATLEVESLKAVHRTTWAAGDYAAVAEVVDVVAPDHLVDRAGVRAGHRTLDVATGTGNVAVRTAAAGAPTIGLDLTPELLEIGRRRAGGLGVEVEWVVGDAEQLPFEDAGFDRVLSAFGVQFTPRHEVTARELVRVCKPGGVIGLCNWTPESAIGELLAILGRSLPPPPGYASPPPLWGSEEHVRALFADDDVELEFERATTPFAFDSAEHWAAFMETNYGPMLKARERLCAEGTWEGCREEIVGMMERRNESADGGLLVPAEYVLVLAR